MMKVNVMYSYDFFNLSSLVIHFIVMYSYDFFNLSSLVIHTYSLGLSIILFL